MAKRRRPEYYYNPLDTKKDVAIGIKLPFNSFYGGLDMPKSALSSSMLPENSDSHGIFELSYSTEDQAASNLKSLLLTRRGERIMHPTFGTDIWDSLFEPKTESLRNSLLTTLNDDIRYWLPYIVITKLNVDFGTYGNNKEDHGLRISIRYKVTDRGAEQTITVFVDESGANITEE